MMKSVKTCAGCAANVPAASPYGGACGIGMKNVQRTIGGMTYWEPPPQCPKPRAMLVQDDGAVKAEFRRSMAALALLIAFVAVVSFVLGVRFAQ